MLREWFVVRVWLLVWSLAVAGQKVQVGHESTQVTANFGSNYCLIVALYERERKSQRRIVNGEKSMSYSSFSHLRQPHK